ncbi:MAG TPA: flavin reductase [Panacibacter sp.]|nr:flavin reductase [Panacibacter sp.]
MQHISLDIIKSWERFYRANFINCLTGFKSVSLIGTVNSSGQPNLAVFSSIVHLGSDPALVGYINRPRAAAPDTLANIESTGFYSINHIQESFVQKAHQTSAKYESGVNEFEATGLTTEFKPGIIAPFVAESNVKYAMKLLEIVPITHNNTFLVIGSITDIFIDETVLKPDGFLAIEEAGSIASLGGDGYYNAQLISRFQYAKPGKEVKPIE